jgi:hypothetical protein
LVLWKKIADAGSRSLTADPETLRDGRWSAVRVVAVDGWAGLSTFLSTFRRPPVVTVVVAA